MENAKDIQIETFGCRLNTYESAVMQRHAQAAGLKDVLIFNTCAVTKEAERQARQAIRRARRANPNTKIIVTGCAAQIDPEGYGAMEEVDFVVGNDLKLKEETWRIPSPAAGAAPSPQGEGKIMVNDIMSVKETAGHLIEGVEGRARAFIQVQNGCDHRCTFCIIPYGRGNSRSVPIGEIATQTRALVENGYNEVVFTGVDVTSYGADLPGKPSFGQMIRRVLALVPELPRLRLSSLDPVEIDDDLWRLIANEPRLMPHLHLSMQAGDDMILKRMKRRHLRQDLYDVVERARALRPDMVFGADIIAGFPTEDEAMFKNTLNAVKDLKLIHLHVFPYSEREGTPAAKIPTNKQVPVPVRKARAAKLRAAGQQNLQDFLKSEVNKARQIIVEKGQIGRTEHFLEVHLAQEFEQGTLLDITVKSQVNGRLQGIPA